MTTEKPRPLNMQEKRKLETLLIEDINRADRAISNKTSDARRELVEKLNAKPPADARALFDLHVRALKQADEAESKLTAIGWRVSGYGEKELAVSERDVRPAALQSFDEKVSATRNAIDEMRRSYVRKLFAGGSEGQDLLGALTKELAKLTA